MSTKWFDRTFDFNTEANNYTLIHSRLVAAPMKISSLVTGVDENLLAEKPGGKWSVKEHVAHLFILEPLWRARILDIQAGTPKLTPADLDNTATSDGGFNNYEIGDLAAKFLKERSETILLLSQVDPASVSNKSLYPRMQQELGITDHLYFVAEHDDHHIKYIDAFLTGKK